MGLATSFSDPCFMNFRVRPVQIAAMRKAVGEIRKSGRLGHLSIYKVFGMCMYVVLPSAPTRLLRCDGW